MVTKTEKNEVFKQMVAGHHVDCSRCCYDCCGIKVVQDPKFVEVNSNIHKSKRIHVAFNILHIIKNRV